MSSSMKYFSMSILLWLLPVCASGSDDKHVLTFDQAKLHFSKLDGYDLVRYADVVPSHKNGSPQVPECIVHLALPPGKEIASVTVTHIRSDTIKGQFELFPVQPPQILSNPNIRFASPDQGIYSSGELFPKDIIQAVPHGDLSGYSLGALIVYPVQYVPLKKMLIFHPEIDLQVSYKDAESPPLPGKETPHSASILQKAVTGMVLNPGSLPHTLIRETQSISLLPDEEHEYLLITGESYVSSFQPLCDWKLRKGLSAKIVTVEWIASHYTGTDLQEKIRNFIRDAHQRWGTLWVLLGGDIGVVPQRNAYAMDCQYGSPSDNFIPCDLYYSDLDGTWNANGNDTLGEIADSVDMYSDVYVGRAPVNDQSQASVFVSKILTYEKNPPLNYENRALFLAQVLWNSPYTNCGINKNYIDSLYFPSHIDSITKLYQDLGNESLAAALSALNAGQNIVNHDGHAWTGVLGLGEEYLGISDMDALANGPRYSILYSIGCWPASFDYDCIAEHFVRNPNGGGVAFIGNSRYGWGSPGNPLYGYSDRFDQQFFKKLFQENIYHIGNTLAAAKSVYVPLAQQENVYRWCEYEVNLLGDPEMPIWTSIPRPLTVSCPSELPTGTIICQIVVTDGTKGVEGALVCLMQDSVVYTTGLTGAGGQMNLRISTSDPSRPLHLTVTARNFLPSENSISLATQGPYACISSYSTNGSSEGYVNPGDSASMSVGLKNFGSSPAGSVSILLRSEDQNIRITDSTAFTSVLAPGDSILIQDAFSFRVDTGLHNGAVANLKAIISDTAGHSWSNTLCVTGATPKIAYLQYQVSDSLLGNGNGFADPGETLSVKITLSNAGLRTAHNVSATLESSDPHLRFLDSMLSFGSLPPSAPRYRSARIAITDTCPDPSFPQVMLHFRADGGYRSLDSFALSVGTFGLTDDMEQGGGNWSHSGGIDLWHLTTHRKHSGNASWYCGDENQFQYQNNMANTLSSTFIVLDQNSLLSFWCWYQFPNYGTDGLYVETNDGSGWVTLDFIGSGGALGSLVTWNNWMEYTYDLSHYPKGTVLQVRFRVVSDGSDVAEGAYIDDVKIRRRQQEYVLLNATTVDFARGWNIVSVPRILSDCLKTSIFPSTPGSALSYNGAYQVEDTLKNGVGYWLKFPTDQTLGIIGDPIDVDSITANQGWNLIGSISTPILASSIASIPGGLQTSPFWGYNGHYTCADSIIPGKGYWVKLSQAGTLILSALGAESVHDRVKIMPSTELPPLPPEEASGRRDHPRAYALEANYPNPFNPSTTVRYQLPTESSVTLKIYDVLGQVVQVLTDGIQGAGYWSARWEASAAASGVYYYELKATSISEPGVTFTQVRKMILLR